MEDGDEAALFELQGMVHLHLLLAYVACLYHPVWLYSESDPGVFPELLR